MPIFYSPVIKDKLSLDQEESKHCLKVLRKKIDDTLEITDGKGNLFTYSITDISPKTCLLELVRQITKATIPTHHIHIAISPTKNNDRLEWFVEKATELGVHEISLIVTQNSERRHAKIDRLVKKATAAMKQSGNLFLPRINELKPLKEFVKNQEVKSFKYVAYVPTNKTALLFNKAQKNNNYTILIGPEGDFSPEEIDLATNNGFQCVSLGPHVLRTETAGLAAVQQLSLLNY